MWSYVSTALPWIGYVVLLVLIVVGLLVNILGLPGLWLIVLGVVGYAWMTEFAFIGWWTIGIIIALGLSAELIEFAAGAAGSAKAGGSKRGMAGAVVGGIVGGVVGTPWLPVIGTIIGSVIGCALGAYLIEWTIGKTHTQSIAIGVGAAKGKAIGLAAKSVFGVAMGAVAITMGLPIHWGSDTRQTVPAAPSPSTMPATQPATAP